MEEAHTDLPPDMMLFIDTPVAQPFVQGRNTGLVVTVVLAIAMGAVLRWLRVTWLVSSVVAVAVLLLNATVLLMRYGSHASTPLAVNMNHPFVLDEALGDARLLVRLSDGRWVDPGPHPVRTTADELIGGSSLLSDTDTYPLIGHFTTNDERDPTVLRHIAIINQAIALRDAVNEVPDPIENARERESMETGLLERSWLEDEREVEVESPLVSFFRAKE